LTEQSGLGNHVHFAGQRNAWEARRRWSWTARLTCSPPRDPDALAEAITTLLHNPDLRREMGQAGRERVTQCFTVERMVEPTQLLYEQLLVEKGIVPDGQPPMNKRRSSQPRKGLR